MNEFMMLEAVERYLNGEMGAEEKQHFEQLRQTNPELDQLVVEQTLFLQQMNKFGNRQRLKATLHETHIQLDEAGEIDPPVVTGKARIKYLWNRYKRVAAIAASIAGVTAVSLSVLIWSITPKPQLNTEQLSGEIKEIRQNQISTSHEISTIKENIKKDNTSNRIAEEFTTGAGTAFVIDAKGYLVTNAHVVGNRRDVALENEKGEYYAKVVYVDAARDLAILKIDDENFKPFNTIPYSISRNSADLAEPIFTLGYPRSEIVYGQGYLSAATGYQGDTLSCQIEINANHGNSGSPILNRNGDVIGVLSSRQVNAAGTTFAIQARNIYRAMDELKKDTAYQNIKVSSKSAISGMDRTQQVKKITDYVFMVKVN